MDVAKRLTFRIRGGMLMVGWGEYTKRERHQREKNCSCNWGLLYKSEGLPEQAVVQDISLKIRRNLTDSAVPRLLSISTCPASQGLKVTSQSSLCTSWLRRGLEEYQKCIRTRKYQYKSEPIHYGEKLVVSDSLHNVVFGLTLDSLINLERSSYMTGCPVHQLKK